ncbi:MULTISPECIES: DUF3413 domain-containing protein [Arcobacteraceae]|uniref:Inner membrane protein YejM n=3 Tax=Arcobacteraceae TaxID=2808963 RepID=A0A5C2HE22_9BACT|nr:MULTISPECIES: DUF3413 domain-containing protein [Arcobacteraceae]OCL95554.1 Inner membrane protein YejM [Aliarcobacter thereius LMG 24486]OCL96651.1 Inner membrane protein YejM [Aliarcobacter thereius]QBF16461.1 inner membrane protein YejM [Aliarcobacter thereius LMG 24486]QEP41099.1 inner membrane protein YejM [Arcobacter porcinus]
MDIKNKNKVFLIFIIVNIMLSIIIISTNLAFLPDNSFIISDILFMITSTFSHVSILVLLFSPIIYISLSFKNILKYIVIGFSSALLILLLYIDTVVFSIYRFHINYTLLELVLSGGIVEFSENTIFKVIISFILILSIEILLLIYIERKINLVKRYKISKYFIVILILSFLVSSVMHIYASAYSYSPITSFRKYLPLYYPITSNSLMRKLGLFDANEYERIKELKRSFNNDVKYPIRTLDKNDNIDSPNIVFIVIDSWRYDTFNQKITPNLFEYSKNGIVLNKHMSSGNSTRAGLFGLFYGITSTYWMSMLNNNIAPIFIERLQELDYQIGIFASAKLHKPEFDKTIFRTIPNLRMESNGSKPWEKDISITNEWLEWYKNRDKSKSNFSFLFYDSPHGTSFPDEYPDVIEPYSENIDYLNLSKDTNSEIYFNRYKTSVHYTDSLIKKVINNLEEDNALENTIIIITGDHGEEFNDNNDGYWGHNSNFTSYQVHVPFIIIDNINKSSLLSINKSFLTTHNDIVPTLLKNHLGILNDIKDYSSGVDLYKYDKNRNWILSSSYSKYAIITGEEIFEISDIGQYRIYNNRNNDIKNKEIYKEIYKEALKEISRFNK